MREKINQQSVENKLKENLIGKPLSISIGYGGVLFAESDAISLYSDESWFIAKNGKQLLDRWQDDQDREDDIVSSINNSKINNVLVENKKTTFNYENDYSLEIPNAEELETWEITLKNEGVRITAHGDGTFDEKAYKPEPTADPSELRKRIKIMSAKNTDPLLNDMYKENLPISADNAMKFVQSIVGKKVAEVEVDSASTFTLRFDSNQAIISIEDSWELVIAGKKLVDSNSRFSFGEVVTSTLTGIKLTSIEFDEKIDETKINFENSTVLTIRKTKSIPGKSGIWTIFDTENGLHISANRDGKLDYLVLVPDQLKKKYHYDEKGSTWANIMYALDFYRGFIAE